MEEHESRPNFLELMECFHKYCQTPGRYLYIEVMCFNVFQCEILSLLSQGDEYAITRTTPYTPSPAPWTEMKQLPSSFRGVPDGNPGPPDGTGFPFRYPEERHFFDYHGGGEGVANPEAESLLPQRLGFEQQQPHRRFFSHSNETRIRANGRQERPSTNSSTASTSLYPRQTSTAMGLNANFPAWGGLNFIN